MSSSSRSVAGCATCPVSREPPISGTRPPFWSSIPTLSRQEGPMSAPCPDLAEGAAHGGVTDRMLVFEIDGRELGVPIADVVEIIRYRSAAPVPNAAPPVVGILPLRGRMVTVIDVRQALGLAKRCSGSMGQVIVLDSSGDLLGLAVDAVRCVAGPTDDPRPLDLDQLLAGIS